MLTNRFHYQTDAPRSFQGLESTMSNNEGHNTNTNSGGNHSEDVLPKLVGSKKLRRLAYQIRTYYQHENPTAVLLLEKTNVQYWVDNRVSLIGDVSLSKSFPRMNGGSDNQKRWAVAIRSKFAETFPESKLMYSQTQAKFWVENRRIFDFAILGYQTAENEVVSVDSE